MASSIDKLAKELKNQIAASDERKPRPYDTQAEVLRVENGVAWVHIPGGVDETPVRLTINAKKGDMVNIHVANGTAWITGNSTNPPTDDSTADYAINISNEVKKNVTILNTVVAENIEATNARFIDVEADTAKIHTLTAEKILATVGYIDDLTADNITAEDISASSGYIKDLKADNITAQDISASSGFIKDLKADNITAQDISASSGYIKDLTAENIAAQDVIADHATVGSLDTTYAKINAANIDTATIRNAWVDKIMVQTGLLAYSSQIYTLDAIEVNAANITAGTLDVNRLIVTVGEGSSAQKYLVNIDPSTGAPSYEKLDGNIVEPRTITANKIVANSITTDEITVNNLVGTSGWINLHEGKFFYGNGADFATSANAISWNGSKLQIKADEFLLSTGKTIQDSIESVENWFYSVPPTTSNPPANSWTTTNLKEQHLRDIYFDTTSGKSYRWAKEGSIYKWVEIEDVELSALAKDLHDNYPPRSEFTVAPNQIQSTVSAAQTAATNAANSATDTKLQSYYTKTQTDSAITQRAGEISLSVAQTEIGKIEVGGRNLVPVTHMFSGSGRVVPSTNQSYINTVSNARGCPLCHTSDILADLVPSTVGEGEEIVVSFDFKIDSGGDASHSISFYAYQTNGISIAPGTHFLTADEKQITWTRITRVTNAYNFGDLNTSRTIGCIYFYDNTGNNYFSIRNVKIERGNKATDWTPAPEDVEAYTDTQVSAAKAEIKVTTDGISTEVAKKTDKETIISTIRQSAESVKIKASQVEIDGTATFNAIKSSTDAAYDAKGAAQTAVDGIEVGGRNLFGYGSDCQNSLDGLVQSTVRFSIVTEDGIKCAHISGQKNNTGHLGSSILYTPKPLEWFTFSAWVKLKNISAGTTNYLLGTYFSGETISGGWRGVQNVSIYVDGVKESGDQGKWTEYITDTNWHHLVITAQYQNYAYSANFRGYVYARDFTGDMYVHHIKWERGTKATDWTPAPEDVQAEIDAKKSVWTLMTSGTGSTYANILNWTTEGRESTSWGIDTTATPIDKIKVGDTVRVAYKVTDMNSAYVYVIGTFERSSGSTVYLTMHGLDTTIIDGGNILTNSIGANKIKVNEIEIGAAQITSGTIATARIPNLDAGKITTGTINIGRIPNDALNSNVEIGGRNLLGNTSIPYVPDGANSSAEMTFGNIGRYNSPASEFSIESYDGSTNSMVITSSVTGNRGVSWYTKAGDVVAGETYTFSCRVKTSVAATVHTHTAWRNGSATAGYTGWTIGGNLTTVADTWTDYSYTFTPSTSAELTWEFLVALCFTGATTGITCRIAHPKLEKGNKATDWTPSPYDMATAMELSVETLNEDSKLFKNVASYYSNSNPYTGYIAITTPITPNRMNNVHISGYNYSADGRVIDINVGFYNYQSSMAQASFTNKGDFDVGEVRVAKVSSSDTRAVIILGTASKKWYYPRLIVDEALITYNSPPDSYVDGWSITTLGTSIPSTYVQTASCKQYNASKTATNYVTDINSAGIFISPSNQSPTSTSAGNSVKIDGTGMEVYKGGASVAFYGDSARVGKSATRHIEIGDGGLQVYQDGSTVMAHLGYGSGNAESGTATAPYFVFGQLNGSPTLGNYSVTEGSNSAAVGVCSHAEGGYTQAIGVYSHAEGYDTEANGHRSHAEGQKCYANGFASHAEGEETVANGAYSHAAGRYTTAGYNCQMVIGVYNQNKSSNMFEIGNGTLSTPKNIFEVDTSGNVNIPSGANYKINGTSISSTTRKTFTPTSGASYSGYGGCYYEKYGNVVHVHVGVSGLTANTATNISTLPAGYRPHSTVFAHGTGGTWNNLGYLEITSAGVVTVRSAGTYCGADVTFIV